MFIGFVKQTEKQPKQIEFRFVSVWTEKNNYCFEDTLPPGDLINGVSSPCAGDYACKHVSMNEPKQNCMHASFIEECMDVSLFCALWILQ